MEQFKFEDLEYVRPDFDRLGQIVDGYTDRLKKAASYEEAKAVFLEQDETSKKLTTVCTIASVRHTLDTTDEFYEKEDEYINEQIPVVMPKLLAFSEALSESTFCKSGSAEKNILRGKYSADAERSKA